MNSAANIEIAHREARRLMRGALGLRMLMAMEPEIRLAEVVEQAA